MTLIGFCLSSEEHGAPDLLRFAVAAEGAGFHDLVLSDHFHPWIEEEGNSPFVWSVLGGIAATTGLRVGTGVTCPIMRVHPAIIAQAAATTASMCSGGLQPPGRVAGFDEIYVQQVGSDQLGFLDFWFEQVAPHLDDHRL
jgi:hypothetical protein